MTRGVEAQIRERLQALNPETLELRDDSALHAGHEGARGGGGHFDLTIVSAQFAGKNTIARHRLIYEALGPLMRREIHALAIRAYAPGESPAPSSTSRKDTR
ncbi:MAG: BolA family transcriptional regulator [Betaproteobacteria bacterium]|nr:BolA family transcriptional regulator [Betaproteobacteria bacterium]